MDEDQMCTAERQYSPFLPAESSAETQYHLTTDEQLARMPPTRRRHEARRPTGRSSGPRHQETAQLYSGLYDDQNPHAGESAIADARRRRSLVSGGTRLAREGLNAMSRAYPGSSGLGSAAQGTEEVLGSQSEFSSGLRFMNYAARISQNMENGQSIPESASSGIAAAAMDNEASGALWSAEPSVGLVDTTVNMLNAGMNVCGAPQEYTQATQLAADFTPSQMATNSSSLLGRTAWNVAEGTYTSVRDGGIANGDWSGLDRTRRDLTRGQYGGPLQGYAMFGELLSAANSSEPISRTTRQMSDAYQGQLLPEIGESISASIAERRNPIERACGRGIYAACAPSGQPSPSQQQARPPASRNSRHSNDVTLGGYSPDSSGRPRYY